MMDSNSSADPMVGGMEIVEWVRLRQLPYYDEYHYHMFYSRIGDTGSGAEDGNTSQQQQ